MSEYYEIAYAAASNRLCFFTGTGFSKAVSNNQAPSWRGLLEKVSDLTEKPDEIKESLFPSEGVPPLSLEEAAQAISLELLKLDKNIYNEISKIIKEINLEGNNSDIIDFLSKKSFRVITTNYDKLIQKLIGEQECHTITPGLPIPRSLARAKVYHVHGSVDSPENMVVTSDDYFKFINSESYFSRKLSTTLHENTIVILGYSLGDTNLKAIISDYKGFSRNHVIGSNIFLVSRSLVGQHVKDYYSHCYGIRVLDDIDVHTFFKTLNSYMPEAENYSAKSISNINDVIYNDHCYNDIYLNTENSFFDIISSIAAIGLSINDSRVVDALGEVIKSKKALTKVSGAWEQYTHLANWLIYLASILELKGTTLEAIYLDATHESMTTMSRTLTIGYSWHAYKAWNKRWSSIIASNRVLIKNYIIKNTTDPDALSIVNRI